MGSLPIPDDDVSARAISSATDCETTAAIFPESPESSTAHNPDQTIDTVNVDGLDDRAAQDGPAVFDPSATTSLGGGSSPSHEPGAGVADFDAIAAAQGAAPPGFEVLGILGRGGMGVVYSARQRALKRRVALKMVTAGVHASPEQLVRFQVEAEAVASLQHVNIVQIYEVGEHNGIPFFSLEYVDGGSLGEQIIAHPLSPRKGANLVEKLAGAMSYAHQRGIVHRDLKPGNVLMTSDGIPKITDFGLAKRIDGEASSSRTEAGSILGTPSYMAPEQAKGDVTEVGPLADVYALGAVLYHVLTGRPPFIGATLLETLELVRAQEALSVRQLQPQVPRDLDTICLKCLQKEPTKRYADAEALRRDLGHFLAGEPIEARPVGNWERFYRWCRRNPRVAALSGAVLCLLVTVAVTSTTLLIQIAQEKKQTELERQAAIDARDLARRNERLAKAAQQQAEDAEKIARQNAIVAGEQGRLAVNTLYQVVTKVQQQLRQQPGNQKLRIDLLSDAFAGLTKVVAGSESSELVGRTKAAAHQLMGDISKELGRAEAALKDYQAAQKIVDALAAAEPANEIAIWNQAAVYYKLGEINHEILGDGAVARDYYRKCLELRRGLAGSTPKSPELTLAIVKSRLALTYAKLAELALVLGNPTEAWTDLQSSLELQPGGRRFQSPKDALDVARDPKTKSNLFSAATCRQIGELGFHLNDVDTCRGWYGRALELGLEGVKKTPNSDDAKRSLALCYWSLGDLELQTGNAAGARKPYLQAHQILETIHVGNPDSADAQRNLAMACYRMGTAHLRLGELPESEKCYQASLQVRQELAKLEPQNAYNQINLALALARCGQHIQAAEQSKKLRTRAPDDPGVLFIAASTYALCSAAAANGPSKDAELQVRYANSAIDAINQAVACGYRDIVALEQDPDLDPVRNEGRFLEIIEKLKKPLIKTGAQ
jgi:serine/threonine-protein kinase